MLKLRNEEALLNKRFMDPGKAGFEYVRNTQTGGMKDALDYLIDKNHVSAYVDTPYKRWEKRNQLKKIDRDRLRSD